MLQCPIPKKRTKTRMDQFQSKRRFCARNETIKCLSNKLTIKSKINKEKKEQTLDASNAENSYKS